MDHATNFALDIQEKMPETIAEFQALLNKYGGTKRPDGITLDFSDGSFARWVEAEQSWELNPKD